MASATKVSVRRHSKVYIFVPQAENMEDEETLDDLILPPRDDVTVQKRDPRDHYDIKDELGRGKFGIVYKAIKKDNSEEVTAAKFIKITSKSPRKQILEEIEIMKKLHHKRLVNLIDVYDMTRQMIVIMEYVSGGELFERVVAEDNLTESEAAMFIKQILQGLHHMHEKNIIHLDLKPENIVCVSKGSTDIKLIDFGLAKQLDPAKEFRVTCGTPEFVAPEVLNYDPITLASDMWSVGVVSYILLSGMSPFLGEDDNETLVNVSSVDWDFEDEAFDEISNEAKDFIEGLLIEGPRKRRSILQCLDHIWIKSHTDKKDKKLKLDKLKRFLAKRRWQKSVNAVRAIRRLSSFGALFRKSLNSPTTSLDEDFKNEQIKEEDESILKEDQPEVNVREPTKEQVGIKAKLGKQINVSSQDVKNSGETSKDLETTENSENSSSVQTHDNLSDLDDVFVDEKQLDSDHQLHEEQFVKEESISESRKGFKEVNNNHKENSVDAGKISEEQDRRHEGSDHTIGDSKNEQHEKEKEYIKEKPCYGNSGVLKESNSVLDQEHEHEHKHEKSQRHEKEHIIEEAVEESRCELDAVVHRKSESEHETDHERDNEISDFRQTSKELRQYLQRMINEGKLPGKESEMESGRRLSAQARRTSFGNLLRRSVDVSIVEPETVEEEDTAPPVEVRKESFDKYYETMEEIGRGRFGVVNKVKEKSTGISYAAKHIKVRSSTRELVRQEIEILNILRHRRIVKLRDAFEEPRRFIMVLELVNGGELFEKLSREDCIIETEAVFFVKQILEGMRAMHDKDIMHLDLKPENIMLVHPHSTDIKIIDFGFAKKFDPNQEYKVLAGTPEFSAPEIINFEKITKATDLWSVGVTAYVLLSGISPFQGDTPNETCSNVTAGQWDFEDESFEDVSSEAKDFITKLIVKEPSQRMTVHQCFDHPWIKNIAKRRASRINTRGLFKFTRSFSQSVDICDETGSKVNRPPLRRASNVDSASPKLIRAKETNANEAENSRAADIDKSSKTDKNLTEMENSKDASPSHVAIKITSETDVLEDKVKYLEAQCNGLQNRMRAQWDLETEIEHLKYELEKSLHAHKKLQETVLDFEEENEKLKKKYNAEKKEKNNIEIAKNELQHEVELKAKIIDSLERKHHNLQETMNNSKELKEKLSILDREKTRYLCKITELEENILTLKQGQELRTEEHDKFKKRMKKEKKELTEKIDEYCLEIDELDGKLDQVEQENKGLRQEIEKLKIEKDSTNSDELRKLLSDLENENKKIKGQLSHEVATRKTSETDKLNLVGKLEITVKELETKLQLLQKQNRKISAENSLEISEIRLLLEKSKKRCRDLEDDLVQSNKQKGHEEEKRQNQMKDAEKKTFEIIKERDSAKDQLNVLERRFKEVTENNSKAEERYQDKIAQLELKLNSLKKNDQTANHLERKPSSPKLILEITKADLKMTQEHLRIATDKNAELQRELTKVQKAHSVEEAQMRLDFQTAMEEQKTSLTEAYDKEKGELEDKVTQQESMIKDLLARIKSRDEVPATDSGSSSPKAVNRMRKSSYQGGSTSRMNGPARAESLSSLIDDELNNNEDTDTLSDRELRRIAYKIADGNWSKLGPTLGVKGMDYEQLLCSNLNVQEKIFRLLVLWKSQNNQPRGTLIPQLSDALEKTRRKDAARFVRDIGRVENSGSSVQSIKRKFMSSLKRS